MDDKIIKRTTCLFGKKEKEKGWSSWFPYLWALNSSVWYMLILALPEKTMMWLQLTCWDLCMIRPGIPSLQTEAQCAFPHLSACVLCFPCLHHWVDTLVFKEAMFRIRALIWMSRFINYMKCWFPCNQKWIPSQLLKLKLEIPIKAQW